MMIQLSVSLFVLVFLALCFLSLLIYFLGSFFGGSGSSKETSEGTEDKRDIMTLYCRLRVASSNLARELEELKLANSDLQSERDYFKNLYYEQRRKLDDVSELYERLDNQYDKLVFKYRKLEQEIDEYNGC